MFFDMWKPITNGWTDIWIIHVYYKVLQLMNRRYPPFSIQTPKHDCQSQGSIRSSCYWCCNSPESCDSTQRLRIQKSETTHHDRDHQLEYIRGLCMMPLVDTKIDYTPWRYSFEKVAKSLNISELVRVIESSMHHCAPHATTLLSCFKYWQLPKTSLQFGSKIINAHLRLDRSLNTQHVSWPIVSLLIS